VDTETRILNGPRSGGVPVVGDLVRMARPRQWTKNAVCFAALVFAGKLGSPQALGLAGVVFGCFCVASSAVYVFNDVCDREQDRAHARKRHRPLAAGRVGVGTALLAAVVLAGAALSLSLLLPPRARWVVGAYLALNLAYSLWLRHVAIVDVMSIAIGFVLRVQAGIEAIAAPQSAWIVLCMFFIALFLGFGKRRSELALPSREGSARSRAALGGYSIGALDHLLVLSATTAIVCYSLYAVTVQPDETFGLTILPVVFGVVRYVMLVLGETAGEDPGEVLTRDVPLIVTVLVWAGLCVSILYFRLSLLPGTVAH
jgi:4-hydroxybenzoate polyprenyltransferase